jgi:hypothetical protein
MNFKKCKDKKKEYYYITYLKWLFSNKNKNTKILDSSYFSGKWGWNLVGQANIQSTMARATQPAQMEYVPTGHDWCTSATASLEHEFQDVGGCNPFGVVALFSCTLDGDTGIFPIV